MALSAIRRLPRNRAIPLAFMAVLITVLGVLQALSPAYGVQILNRSLQLTDATASAKSTYRVGFLYTTPGTVGSVRIQLCSNDPVPDEPCTAPAGLDMSAAVITTQIGPNGFSKGPGSSANQIILSRPPSAVGVEPGTYILSNVTNPSAPGTYFVRLQTYATSDATGPASDYGGIAFSINNGFSVSATVPPYLLFCTGITITGFNCTNAKGDFLNLGELSNAQANSGTSQFLVGTNAAQGYNVSAQGPTLTSGSNEITALLTNDVSRPGVGQFGFNLRANASPSVGSDPAGPGQSQPTAAYNTPNSYRYANQDVLVSRLSPDDVRLFTASYLVNVPKTQAAGIYVTTLTYICLANF